MATKYKILRKIGAGGMGEVFCASDHEHGREVAIKILPAQLSYNEEVKKRFLREMVTCAKLDHPNIIRVFDYGQLNETLYYVMEFIDGKSVSDLIEAKGALAVPFSLRVASQMLGALGYIHERSIIHRDVKPSNVLIAGADSGAERAVLMDFGLVKAFDSQLTRTGRVLGTPRYIAPEMLYQGHVDHRSDLFQLGVILYEMVTGVHAFKGSTRAEVARACLTASPERPGLLNPAVDINLENVIYNALEKDPEQRYATAAEMLEDVRAAERGRKIYRRAVRKTKETSRKVPTVETIESTDPAFTQMIEQGSPAASDPVRWLWFLVPALMLPFILYVAYGQGPVYSARNVHVEAGVDRAVVTWQSDAPFETQLQYGQSTASMTTVSARGGPTRTHRLELGPLKEDTSYVVQVRFPDGRLAPDQQFRTSGFRLSDVGVRYGAQGLLDVSWRTNLPTRGRVEYGPEGAPRVVAEEEFNVIHRQLLEVPDPTRECYVRIVVVAQDGKERTSERRTVPSPLALADELARSLTGLAPEAVFGELQSSPEARSGDRGALRQLAERRLDSLPFRKPFRAFAPAARLFFDDARVPVARKIELYTALARLRDLDAALTTLGLEPQTGAADLASAAFKLSDETTFKGVSLETLPVAIPRGSTLTSDPRGAVGQTVGELEFPLLLLDAGRFLRAEVRLVLEELPSLAKLELTLNDRVTLVYQNLDPEAVEGRRDLAHSFDPSLLREGRNVFRLVVRPVLPNLPPFTVRVRSVTLAFVPRRPSGG